MQKCAHLNRDLKGVIHISIKKKWVSHIQFSWKKGANRTPGSAKKGAIRASYPYHAIYRELPHPRAFNTSKIYTWNISMTHSRSLGCQKMLN